MTDTPTVPDAAVRIVREVVNRAPYGDDPLHVREVVATLAAAGWLHDPAEIERLRDRVAEQELHQHEEKLAAELEAENDQEKRSP